MKPPAWLVDNFLTEGGFFSLYGASESLKSFVAIDLALHVATGKPWHGRAIRKPGLVIYVSAEGGSGIGKRAQAWLWAHDCTPEQIDMAWLTQSLTMASDHEDVAVILERIDELEVTPSMVILDTLHRVFDGDENKQEDMGRFVRAIDTIRDKGSAVGVVHHSGLDESRMRGSSAFKAALDTLVKITYDRASMVVSCSCEKQKDSDHFSPFNLQAVEVPIVLAGETTHSLVLTDAPDQDALREERMAKVVQVLAANGPMPWDAWKSLLPDGELTRYFAGLQAAGKVYKSGKLWRAR